MKSVACIFALAFALFQGATAQYIANEYCGAPAIGYGSPCGPVISSPVISSPVLSSPIYGSPAISAPVVSGYPGAYTQIAPLLPSSTVASGLVDTLNLLTVASTLDLTLPPSACASGLGYGYGYNGCGCGGYY